MKHCPQCQRTYSAETISFCLEDGQLLIGDYQAAVTLPLTSARATNEEPTLVMRPPVSPKVAQKRIRTLWIVGGIVALCGFIFYLVLFATLAGKEDTPPIALMLVSSLLGGVIYGYLIWSVCWALPVVWKWWRDITKEPLRQLANKVRFNWAVILVVLLLLGPALTLFTLYFWVPFLAGIVYGFFGGGIYHFIQFRRIARSAGAD